MEDKIINFSVMIPSSLVAKDILKIFAEKNGFSGGDESEQIAFIQTFLSNFLQNSMKECFIHHFTYCEKQIKKKEFEDCFNI